MVACSGFVDGFLLMRLSVLLMVFVGFVDAIARFVGFSCGWWSLGLWDLLGLWSSLIYFFFFLFY